MSLAALLLLTLFSGPVAGQVPVPGETRDAPQEELRHDNRGRPVVSVTINGRGPFDMVVDTAAQTSLIAPSLADELALSPLGGNLRIAGATGSTQAQIYPVDRLNNRLVDARRVGIAAFPNPQVTSARGILGMEHFTGRALLFDRVARRVSALPSAPAAPGFATLKGVRRSDGLIAVPVRVNGVTVDALVDTGAAISLANPAALKAMGWEANDPRLRPGGEVRGAAAGTSGIAVATMDTLAIGPATLRQVPLYFTLQPDGKGPQLILGSDLLNLFEAFSVDFPRAELHIRLPQRPR